VLDLLCTGHVVSCTSPLYGSNDSYLLRLARTPDNSEIVCGAVYKPRRGEAPLWDFPDGSLFRREYAAFLTSRALGWMFVPPTAIRTGPHGIGSIQLFVPCDPTTQYHTFREAHRQDLMRMALFDCLVNNADRKAAHCLKGMDGRIWAIDHGLTFHTHPKLRTVMYEFLGGPVPDWILTDVAALLQRERSGHALRQALTVLLEKQEVDLFFKRLEHVLARGVYPEGNAYRQRAFDWW